MYCVWFAKTFFWQGKGVQEVRHHFQTTLTLSRGRFSQIPLAWITDGMLFRLDDVGNPL